MILPKQPHSKTLKYGMTCFRNIKILKLSRYLLAIKSIEKTKDRSVLKRDKPKPPSTDVNILRFPPNRAINLKTFSTA